MQSTILRSRAVRLVFVLLLVAGMFFAGCRGGGGDSSSTPITSFELLDPTPGASNEFGSSVVILANGNIAVVAPFDSSVASFSGAVHLYNPVTQTRIASIYGNAAGDSLGPLAHTSITALPNGNFVIASPSADEGGIVSACSVRLVNGTTGAPIGSAIVGNAASDSLGSGGVTALPNGNFVIASPEDDEGGIVDAGSVRLVDGTTGAPIGSAIVGNAASDSLGSGGVTALPNGNFVIASPSEDAGGIVNAGSVRLVSGTTGAPIGIAIVGDVAGDFLGSGDGSGGITALPNGDFVIASPGDDVGGIVDAGSVRLANATRRASVVSAIVGNAACDTLGSGGITALPNGNFVIVSHIEDVGGIVNAGSVRLVDGTTGAPIGSAITGGVNGDVSGALVTPSAAGNFFILGLPLWNKNGIVDSGMVRLIAP